MCNRANSPLSDRCHPHPKAITCKPKQLPFYSHFCFFAVVTRCIHYTRCIHCIHCSDSRCMCHLKWEPTLSQ